MALPGQVVTPPPFVRLAAHPLRWTMLTVLAGGDYRVRELAVALGEPQNLVSYHLGLLRRSGLVSARRSDFDGRDSYYQLDLDRAADELASTGAALHPSLGPITPPLTTAEPEGPPRPVTVLFVCTGNSARSPMAEAMLRGRGVIGLTVTSAGVRPKPGVHPGAARVIHEQFGLDISTQRPRGLEALAGHRFDRVITLCDKARENLPDYNDHPGRVHWSIPDPATMLEATGDVAFRATATDLERRIRHLLPALV